MNDGSTAPVYSVVVPFYNEADSLQSLLAEIRAAMVAIGEPWEAIFVNDGSRDATDAKLREGTADWSDCSVITMPRNRGQAAALWAGFQAARGTWIITLDGDGQNVPADIPTLLPLRQGHDMVVGVRVSRRDSWLRRAMSRIANAVRGRLLRDGLTDSGCALKVFRREVVSSFGGAVQGHGNPGAAPRAAGRKIELRVWRLRVAAARRHARDLVGVAAAVLKRFGKDGGECGVRAPRLQRKRRDGWTGGLAFRGGHHFGEGRQEAVVLRAGADGDAEPFGHAVRLHRADDQAAALQRVEDARAVADFDEDEVGHARHGSCRRARRGRRPGRWR